MPPTRRPGLRESLGQQLRRDLVRRLTSAGCLSLRFAGQKRQALAAHRSQVSGTGRLAPVMRLLVVCPRLFSAGCSEQSFYTGAPGARGVIPLRPVSRHAVAFSSEGPAAPRPAGGTRTARNR